MVVACNCLFDSIGTWTFIIIYEGGNHEVDLITVLIVTLITVLIVQSDGIVGTWTFIINYEGGNHDVDLITVLIVNLITVLIVHSRMSLLPFIF